jgi:hypothetical protein
MIVGKGEAVMYGEESPDRLSGSLILHYKIQSLR